MQWFKLAYWQKTVFVVMTVAVIKKNNNKKAGFCEHKNSLKSEKLSRNL